MGRSRASQAAYIKRIDRLKNELLDLCASEGLSVDEEFQRVRRYHKEDEIPMIAAYERVIDEITTKGPVKL
ncbi:hypothetical protein SEA_KINGBOB_48 [Arthrobacter phage KingBob]|uniref:Uncharacterized protein n=1 Tax=Arthrobacter phage Sergei TaxID=2250416 RepID=A0A345KPY6_9CAUD|nr:hypothetical protein KDJ06_gp48 [Arthrobacter phage Sergei]ASZ74362.1 hypothetical protein TEMPER16_48 [Arthrobacter phage Temper16]AXH43975.1 hypothetical protein SEA_DAIBOJU_48 [Arthrobacter phage Daiboju]AXH44037.1 hypothetical protein SEA_HERB_48 [Arthrobacter phage Herb]AXH44281.1 hypothetical protein SEA_KINGBOB_48 [Arthrobacter phage KingBob]QGJ97188.1 hypothetical protein SEA_MARIA1952_47 [Arthrobacter phage Maria1952]